MLLVSITGDRTGKRKKHTRYSNYLCRHFTEKDRFHRLPFLVYTRFYLASYMLSVDASFLP